MPQEKLSAKSPGTDRLTLEEYLRGPYLEEKREIAEISGRLAEVLPVFATTWDSGWPYEVRNDTAPEIKKSQSTNSMIAFSLATVCTRISNSPLVPSVPWDETERIFEECKNHSEEKFKKAFNKGFREKLESIAQESFEWCVGSASARGGYETQSGTFGENDPLTMCWLVELLRAFNTTPSTQAATLAGVIDNAVREVANRVVDAQTSEGLGLPLRFKDEDSKSLRHAFPYLRCLQLATAHQSYRDLEANPSEQDRYWRYFEKVIHLHLSYYLIPDSRFDPAELVFALEGAMLSRRERLDEGTIGRVFSVLEECQENNPYWRPVTPFVATSKGKVLFPVSVEIANSLLRICKYLDRERLHDAYFSRFAGLLRRYKQWIFAGVVTGKFPVANSTEWTFSGWHSEHVGEPETIHLWETSQVLLFLVHYASMLREHIGRESLIAGQFKLRRPRSLKKSDSQEYLSQEFVKGEPVEGSQPDSFLNAYGAIQQSLVDSRRSKTHAEFSILLYGPPGTGKTTVATKLADRLGYRRITITASDFLARGAAEVEARAKAIFEALSEQIDTVILFDEMDHLLLNRESELYRDQESIFQLMTPGMLSKIADLRDTSKPLFVIATNYAERIDPAIKRPGRIDRHVLLLPPNFSRRKKIVAKALEQEMGAEYSKVEQEIGPAIDSAAKLSALMTLKELERLAVDALKRAGPNPTTQVLGQSLKAELTRSRPLISIRGYRERFKDNGAKPFEEFAALVYLTKEHELQAPLPANAMEAMQLSSEGNDEKSWAALFEQSLDVGPAQAKTLAKEAKRELSA